VEDELIQKVSPEQRLVAERHQSGEYAQRTNAYAGSVNSHGLRLSAHALHLGSVDYRQAQGARDAYWNQ
jgi:hypothetical protein